MWFPSDFFSFFGGLSVLIGLTALWYSTFRIVLSHQALSNIFEIYFRNVEALFYLLKLLRCFTDTL